MSQDASGCCPFHTHGLAPACAHTTRAHSSLTRLAPHRHPPTGLRPPTRADPRRRYNELSTLTIKKTSATTQSVANTAKRVIVIVGVAIALGESLEPVKLLGCGIGIAGVLLYSLVK